MIWNKKILINFVLLSSFIACATSADKRKIQTTTASSTATVSHASSPLPPKSPTSTDPKNRFNRGHTLPTLSVFTQSELSRSPHKTFNDQRLSVGVIIPLSGPNQHWGKLIKKTINKVLRGQDNVQAIFADSQGEASVAIHVLDHWMKTNKVAAVLGPLSPYVAAPFAQRIQWYELPWFPLGSLPSLLKNTFSISWRFEAKNEARMLAGAICSFNLHQVAIVIADQPRAHLTARLLTRALRRCQVKVIMTEVLNISHSQLVSDRSIDQSLVRLSGRRSITNTTSKSKIFNRQKAIQLQPQINYQAMILLIRGRLLSRVVSQFSLWDIEIKPSNQKRVDQLYQKYEGPPPWIQIFTGLGAAPIAKGVVAADQLHGAILIDRPALSTLGKKYVQSNPKATTLELELVDLFTWLVKAQQTTNGRVDHLLKSLRKTQEVEGVWGRRSYQAGELMLPSGRYYQSDHGRLIELEHGFE